MDSAGKRASSRSLIHSRRWFSVQHTLLERRIGRIADAARVARPVSSIYFGFPGGLTNLRPLGPVSLTCSIGAFLNLDEMRHVRRLGVEAAGRQDFQFRVIKRFAIAGREHARQDRDVALRLLRLRQRSHNKHHCGRGQSASQHEVFSIQSNLPHGVKTPLNQEYEPSCMGCRFSPSRHFGTRKQARPARTFTFAQVDVLRRRSHDDHRGSGRQRQKSRFSARGSAGCS